MYISTIFKSELILRMVIISLSMLLLDASFVEADRPSPSGFSLLQYETKTEFDKSIERYRKGNFTILLTDEEGNPFSNTHVLILQQQHEFWFGGALFTPLFEKSKNKREKKYILARADEMFNLVVDGNGFKWRNIEKYGDKINYGFKRHRASTLWAKEHNKDIRHHCLFWSNPRHNPGWLKDLSPEEFKSALFDRIHYTKDNVGEDIKSLDVINEMLYYRYYRDRLGEDIIREIFQEVKKAFPNCRLYLNEWPPQQGKVFSCFDKYIELIKKLKAQNVPFDGIGLQAHFDANSMQALNISMPELMVNMNKIIGNISAAAELPVLITEYDMASKDEDLRADFLEAFYTMAFSNRDVEGIIAWEWFDLGKNNALVTRDGTLTKAGKRYYDLVLGKWWTNCTAITDENGKIRVDAFYGDYDITIKKNGKRYSRQITLRKKAPKVIRVIF